MENETYIICTCVIIEMLYFVNNSLKNGVCLILSVKKGKVSCWQNKMSTTEDKICPEMCISLLKSCVSLVQVRDRNTRMGH